MTNDADIDMNRGSGRDATLLEPQLQTPLAHKRETGCSLVYFALRTTDTSQKKVIGLVSVPDAVR